MVTAQNTRIVWDTRCGTLAPMQRQVYRRLLWSRIWGSFGSSSFLACPALTHRKSHQADLQNSIDKVTVHLTGLLARTLEGRESLVEAVCAFLIHYRSRHKTRWSHCARRYRCHVSSQPSTLPSSSRLHHVSRTNVELAPLHVRMAHVLAGITSRPFPRNVPTPCCAARNPSACSSEACRQRLDGTVSCPTWLTMSDLMRR